MTCREKRPDCENQREGVPGGKSGVSKPETRRCHIRHREGKTVLRALIRNLGNYLADAKMLQRRSKLQGVSDMLIVVKILIER
jgi:hypothetical protein